METYSASLNDNNVKKKKKAKRQKYIFAFGKTLRLC